MADPILDPPGEATAAPTEPAAPHEHVDSAARRARLLSLAAIGGWLVGMAALGLPYAIWRHIHVDEAQVAYNVALWGVHDLGAYSNYAAPFMVPLAWLLGPLESTASMMLVLRTAFFVLFAASLVVLARAQPYAPTRAGRLAVLAAATLCHPFWAHGFEVRHDAILVAGSLILYGLAQQVAGTRRAGRGLLAAAGATCAVMQLDAYKGFLYAVPFGGAVLVAALAARRREPFRARLGVLGWFAAGAAVAAAALVGLLAAAGHLGDYARVIQSFVGAAGASYRFSPAPELVRVALDAPWVYGPAALLLVLAAVDAARRRLRARTALTALFLGWNLLALFVNPVPFPYNFIHLTPFVFLAALDVAARAPLAGTPRRLAVAGVLLVAALLSARAAARDPFLVRTSEAQLSYAAAAEAMTDPTDPVLDGAGLVLSRKPPGRDWMLHSLWMPDYLAGRRVTFAQMMIDQAPPVLLGSYRWGWLPRRDLEVRRDRYVQIYPEIWVLGALVPPAGGEVAIRRAGRYGVRSIDPSDRAPALAVDGTAVTSPAIVALDAGPHRVSGAGRSGAVLYWLGPRLEEVPTVLPLSPPGILFTNE